MLHLCNFEQQTISLILILLNTDVTLSRFTVKNTSADPINITFSALFKPSLQNGRVQFLISPELELLTSQNADGSLRLSADIFEPDNYLCSSIKSINYLTLDALQSQCMKFNNKKSYINNNIVCIVFFIKMFYILINRRVFSYSARVH